MNSFGKVPLRAGILAAGRGERLCTGSEPFKPLVKVGPSTLIEHVLNSLANAGASEVVIIINEDSVRVRDHVMSRSWPFPLRWIIESTPSSMHSFLRLLETLTANGDEGPFLLSTVDTVAAGEAYAQFIGAARQLDDIDVALALTSLGDDEKPLLVRTAPEDTRVIAIGKSAAPTDLATAGLYAVRASVLREGELARSEEVDALRTFLCRLLDRGYKLAGIPIPLSIDVDRPADIRHAEELLRSSTV